MTNPVASIIIDSLSDAGFDNELKHENIRVDIKRKKVLRGRNEGAIILNEGILTSHTLKELLDYHPEEEQRKGMKLANALAGAGIKVNDECFIKLYKVLHDT